MTVQNCDTSRKPVNLRVVLMKGHEFDEMHLLNDLQEYDRLQAANIEDCKQLNCLYSG